MKITHHILDKLFIIFNYIWMNNHNQSWMINHILDMLFINFNYLIGTTTKLIIILSDGF